MKSFQKFRRFPCSYLPWFTDLEESDGRKVDQVVSLRFPAYAVRHPRQVCWLNHTMREYYDQWPAFAAGLSVPGRLKERVRRVIVHAADRRLLGPSRLARLFAQSRTIASRLREHLGLAADVLYPPPPPGRYRTDRFGDYVFAVSRLTPLKRIDLLVRALAEPAGQGLRAVVAGDGDARGTCSTSRVGSMWRGASRSSATWPATCWPRTTPRAARCASRPTGAAGPAGSRRTGRRTRPRGRWPVERSVPRARP